MTRRPLVGGPEARDDAATPRLDLAVFAWEWTRLVAGTSWVAADRTEVADRLTRLTSQLVAALVAEPFRPEAGIEVGEALVRTGYAAPEDKPEELIGRLRELLPPGSFLAISHGTGMGRVANFAAAKELYKTAAPITYRDHDEVRALFDGWDLVEPGVVWLPEWRPSWPDEVGDDPASSMMAGAVGRRS